VRKKWNSGGDYGSETSKGGLTGTKKNFEKLPREIGVNPGKDNGNVGNGGVVPLGIGHSRKKNARSND